MAYDTSYSGEIHGYTDSNNGKFIYWHNNQLNSVNYTGEAKAIGCADGHFYRFVSRICPSIPTAGTWSGGDIDMDDGAILSLVP